MKFLIFYELFPFIYILIVSYPGKTWIDREGEYHLKMHWL